MLQPKRTKFRKQFKGRVKGVAKGGFELAFGEFGLKAMDPERITARQIEAARRAMTRHMKRAGRVWIRVFPDVPVSKKPAEVRMGSGKGSPEYCQAAAQDPLRPAHRRIREGDMKSNQRLSDLRVMTVDQLQDELVKLKKEQFNLRFQRATGQLENMARVREVRRDVARVKTIQRTKLAAAAKG